MATDEKLLLSEKAFKRTVLLINPPIKIVAEMRSISLLGGFLS